MTKVLAADLRLLLTLTLASFLILILDNFHLLNFPKWLLQNLTSPIQYGIYESYLGVSRQFGFVATARQAAQENKALKEQLATQFLENSRLQKQLREAQAMVAQQESLDPKTYNLKPARPIGLGRFLTIDKGSSDGVTVGQVVISRDHYIGQVNSVSSKTSTVLLPEDPDSKLSVFSQGQSGRAKGILEGQFGSEMLMNKILHEEPIESGYLVYSAGLESKLPRGLIVGEVSEVQSRENEVFKTAKVKPILNLGDLDLVYLISDN